ncbi:hypothetical protein WALSEDRAFT_56619 [Wallemia mellicola CBS 633.66]|uniref:DNA polymerase delta subunit 3 n=1 Tax=Wallemia mellicola (strain ATCC MYA-4683 / CBS 633.66) TaxID=671144 RepID=I4YG59_WALMC|nr:hypothetical protein WALSEDRAFT_56619 [Wallemia mellicola CBS 633.66]EIM22951.1 hypothetical protein WALSEDRAFT_56619 [Wallemia mellicola CBS 633.66]|eukprot:XP_006956996.1 hypothetical protein WALSEDRAFT_56619 [Wallemia mellicola CBS 633.66]
MSDENTSSLLDKWIKDDNMIVTSKMLSREIGSRPNIAKNHLLAYYNSNENTVHPVIAISGRTNSASLQTHLTANLDRLEETKKMFIDISSIYLHAISASKITDLTMIVNYEKEYFQHSAPAPSNLPKKAKPAAAPAKKTAPSAVKKEIPKKEEKDAVKPKAKPANGKRRIIESDDEDDITISSPADAPPLAQTHTQAPERMDKKRKVTKSVTKMNEKGYMVTEDVDEWVTDDEAPPPKKTAAAGNASTKPKSKPAASAQAKPKAGQSSLNSFFKKK